MCPLETTTSLPTEAIARAEPGLAGCRVTVIDGPEKGRTFELVKGSATLGKSSSADMRVNDPSVSSQHLRLEVTDQGVRVTDLESTNGTVYLGTRIKEAVVEPGAVLHLGRTRIVIASREPPASQTYSMRSSYGGIIGTAPSMRRMYALLERLEPSDYTVLIEGETGCGKDLVAREIHGHSLRRDKPFEVFDCGAVAPNLAESQMFGHTRGAFTGAEGSREGVFVRGNGGSVFLDEIGELRLELQPKLLRVLEAREVRAVGSDEVRPIDVRVLAATNRSLQDEVRAGRFREDLFFRLNVVTVFVPPLRERREDIPLLVRHFMQSLGGNEVEVSQSTVELFTSSYDWPGNVRELRNAIARVVSVGSLPDNVRKAPPRPGATAGLMEVDTSERFDQAKKRLVEAFERDYLHNQLERAGNNLAKAARMSGMDRAYFKRLLRRYGLLPSRESE